MAYMASIVDFMEAHPDLAKGQIFGPSGKRLQRQFWEELAANLRDNGYGDKPTQKWQKTWTDYKYYLRKKVAHLKREMAKEGKEIPKIIPLNGLESRVLKIMEETCPEASSVEEIWIVNQQISSKRKRTDPEDIQKKKSHISTEPNEFVCSTETISTASAPDLSEFEAVGVNISKKLQRMDAVQAIFAESLINVIIRKGLLNELTENTTLCEGQCHMSRTYLTYSEASPSHLQETKYSDMRDLNQN